MTYRIWFGTFAVAAVAIVTIVTVAEGPLGTHTQSKPASGFTLHFPYGTEMSTVQIDNFLVGPFGGAGGLVSRASPASHDIVVGTAFEGREGSRLKMVIFVPGHRFVTMDVDLTRESREATIALTTLAPLRVKGHVVLPVGRELEGATLHCRLLADWVMDFFGIIDGMVPTFKLGSRPLTSANDYAFEFDVPDVANDPVARRGNELGFSAGSRFGESLSLRLDSDKPIGLVRAVASYPPDLRLSVFDWR